MAPVPASHPNKCIFYFTIWPNYESNINHFGQNVPLFPNYFLFFLTDLKNVIISLIWPTHKPSPILLLLSKPFIHFNFPNFPNPLLTRVENNFLSLKFYSYISAGPMRSSAGGPFGGRKDGFHCLRKTIAFVFALHLLVIVGGQSESEQPTLITSMDKQHFVLPFMQMDQCMLQPEQLKIHSYGLLFRLPNGFLCPEPGLIICYRSQLDPQRTTNGLAMPKQYRVRNHWAPAQQEIAEKCCELNPTECAIMHGIRVSTNENGKNITLELSITDFKYLLPNAEFWINFGQKSNLRTFLRYHDTAKEWVMRREYTREGERFDEFMNNIGHGATMQKFAGLWLLGLDILPMEFINELDLFVYRDCNCTMRAYFTHPTDLADPDEIPLTEFGSNECKINNSVEVKPYHIDGPLVTDNIIKIWFSPNADTKFIEIEMKNEGETILNFTIFNENITYHGENWDYELYRDPLEEILPPSWNIRVEIHMHKYSYEVILEQNNEFIYKNNNFWPTGKMVNKLDDVDILVTTNAMMGRVEKSGIHNNEHFDWAPELPLTLRLDEIVTSGSKFRIHGEIKPNAEYIEINFMHDAPEWHEYIGATCLRIHIDFVNNNISMSTYHSGLKWHNNKTIPDQDLFKQGEAFDLVILMHKNPVMTIYDMKINGKKMDFEGDLPIWTINWYSIKGDRKLLTLPIENYAKDHTNIFKHELEHLFMNGEELCISAKSIKQEQKPTSFQIYLFHEANEEDKKIGDMLLKMDFQFNDQGNAAALYLNSKLHHLQLKSENTRDDQPNKLGDAGQDFSVVISAEQNQYTNAQNETIVRNEYKIVIRGGDAITYPNRNPEKPNNAVILPPSWAVNWFTIANNVENIKIGKESRKCEDQKPLPANIKQIDPKKPLAVGDIITIKGKIKKKVEADLHISIGFFREAVEWHPIIGQTVMQANFIDDFVTFDTYYGKSWKWNGQMNGTLAIPLAEGDNFVMVVEVMEKHYKIQVGGKEFEYRHNWMPYWAVQYIVINGDLEADNGSEFIQIKSDENNRS